MTIKTRLQQTDFSDREILTNSAVDERRLQYLGYLLSETAYYVRRETAIALAPFEMSPRLFGTFDAIARNESLSQRALGKVRRIDRTTIVAQVDALEKAAFVRREDNPNDRREYSLVTTDKGKEILQHARTAVEAVEKQFLARLKSDDRAKLFEILGYLFDTQNTED